MKIKTPRELFQEDEARVKEHQAIVDDPLVVSGLHAAFTSMCWELPGGNDVQSSMRANSMREGARRLIEHFLNLAEQSPPPTRDPAELEPELEPEKENT